MFVPNQGTGIQNGWIMCKNYCGILIFSLNIFRSHSRQTPHFHLTKHRFLGQNLGKLPCVYIYTYIYLYCVHMLYIVYLYHLWISMFVFIYIHISYTYVFTFLAEFDETTRQTVKSQNLRLVVLARGQAILPIKEDVQLLYVARLTALKEFLKEDVPGCGCFFHKKWEETPQHQPKNGAIGKTHQHKNLVKTFWQKTNSKTPIFNPIIWMLISRNLK